MHLKTAVSILFIVSTAIAAYVWLNKAESSVSVLKSSGEESLTIDIPNRPISYAGSSATFETELSWSEILLVLESSQPAGRKVEDAWLFTSGDEIFVLGPVAETTNPNDYELGLQLDFIQQDGDQSISFAFPSYFLNSEIYSNESGLKFDIPFNTSWSRTQHWENFYRDLEGFSSAGSSFSIPASSGRVEFSVQNGEVTLSHEPTP